MAYIVDRCLTVNKVILAFANVIAIIKPVKVG